jgi:hypothetical protein
MAQILIIGDVNVDVVVAPVEPVRPKGSKWQQEKQFREFRRAGGAWLVQELVSDALGDVGQVLGYADTEKEAWCDAACPPCPVSVATIRKYLRDPGVAAEKDRFVYRMDKALLGWVRPARRQVDEAETRMRGALGGLLDDLAGRAGELPAELVVIHDHNNGFRDLDPASWLRFLEGNPHFSAPEGVTVHPRGTILWHTDFPVCGGRLWQVLSERYAAQTVAVVNVEDLREHGVFLKEDLSLEQTAYDFLDQLAYSPMQDLTRLACLVVRFSNGVFVYSHKGLAEEGESLFLGYLPAAPRGGSRQGSEHGLMVGYTLLLLTALAQGIHWAQEKGREQPHHRWLEGFREGIQRGSELGLAYGYMHFREGFLAADFEKDEKSHPHPYSTLLKSFSDRVDGDERYRKALRLGSIEFDATELRGDREDRKWSRVSVLGRGQDELIPWAVRIVREGLVKVLEETREPEARSPWKVLRDRLRFPYFEAGDLLLVGRQEVDSFEGLSTLIRNYLETKAASEPLSIAVFGPPGSGKSFAVKQLLEKAQQGKAASILPFNVAQFRDFRDLAKAFHVVQDHALGDNVPFVFFDEFDSAHESKLGWLKYFLAPMQDGKFRDGETTYQIGRAIFFFAGGTKECFKDFFAQAKQPDLDTAKVPDFVSRLRGYLDIAGINPELEHPVDDVLLIRRAILLRALLRKNCKSIFDPITKVARMNEDVIRAFLLTRKFEHGVRSMEAIVEMAAISLSRESFQKTSVPLVAQLKMHVAADDFLSHIQKPVAPA